MRPAVTLAPDEALPALPALPGVIEAWPGRAELVDGSVTFVRPTPPRSPTAQPALYVHGLGGSSLNWTDLAYLLADRLDGQAIDLPGFGRSDPARSYTVAAAAHRTIRWLEHTGRGPVHLVANSLGGAVTIRVAATRPDLVRTLTLISPALPFLNPRRSNQSRLVPLVFMPGMRRIAARRLTAITPESMVRQMLAACFVEPERMPAQRLAEAAAEIQRRYGQPWLIDAHLRTLRGVMGMFVRAYLPGSGSIWRLATRIEAPTLVIVGGQDRVVDPRVSPAVARRIPDSRLLVLDRVGHVAQMERPRTVARAMVGFFDEVCPV